MLRHVLATTAVLLFTASVAFAQWQAPGTASATTPVQYDGNVGIGTGSTAPPQRFTVKGGHIALDNGQQLIGRNSGNAFYFRLIGNDASDRIILGDATSSVANEIRFHTNGGATPTMLISTSGNLGVGTAAPSAKVHVEDLANSVELIVSAGDAPGTPNSPTMTLMRKDGNHAQVAKYGFKLDASDGNKLKILYGTTGGFTSTALTIDPAGNLLVDGNINAKYQDVAEWVPAEAEMPAGTVVVLNRAKSNEVTQSIKAYDTAVAGVVSEQPGVLLGQAGRDKAKIATTGRVKVRVDARKHPIEVGDLLVTSDKAGMAMLSEPLDIGGVKLHRPGTLIGKALEPLPGGEGEILVLLSLQ